MLLIYSDNGSHFKHNKILHKITCGLVYIQGWPLTTGKITRKDKHRTPTEWLWPLNRGGHLIQVKNSAFACRAKNRDFENWLLNRGWPLNTGPFYTGSTVYVCQTV